MSSSAAIPKDPVLKPAEDYYRLRREGIGFIERISSAIWTDYNVHDPGITILEALCYAITDLAYRTGWDIRDILAPEKPSQKPLEPFPCQPFFTAREILTINPWTPDDFRRLLIDLEPVRNAWVYCRPCTCDTLYYAWCEEGELVVSHEKKQGQLFIAQPVEPLGMYDVLLELEPDMELGSLNDRKVEHRFNPVDGVSEPHQVIMELRFPEWGLHQWEDWELFMTPDASFRPKLKKLGAAPGYDARGDYSGEELDSYLRRHWSSVIYVTLEVTVTPAGGASRTITIEDAALRLVGSSLARNGTEYGMVAAALEDVATADFVGRYQKKLLKVKDVVDEAKATLRQHRNLGEDYCRVKVADVEEVAVCADVEVAPDADIDRIQARIWFEIEQYFNPPVRFYSVQELTDEGLPVEDIFNGPALSNGFLKAHELKAAELKTALRASDIINRLMDIDGVIAVNNLLLTKYDSEGNIVKGFADPSTTGGVLSYDPGKASAAWLLAVAPMHQPRLYFNQSRFQFLKNGLPLPLHLDEALDTLTRLRGEAERPKLKGICQDLPIPTGTYRHLEDYYPLQYSFPSVYGIGPAGLPSSAPASRLARAKQLKAYLMVFDQILGNALAQLAHTADLFSLDADISHTYFFKELSEEVIAGYNDIAGGLGNSDLERMTETEQQFEERRNRFLDHLMARFGEQFNEYTLLLTDSESHRVALQQLIKDKISFLSDYPAISRDRAKAFDHRERPEDQKSLPGLKERVGLLLGGMDMRAILVEHLLLRPKFPGDALYPACSDGGCKVCGDEDPYSFRLTFVIPGSGKPFRTNLALREFIERTIRRETPSHLLVKICWASDEGVESACDAVVDRMAALLGKSHGLSEKEACKCAAAAIERFRSAFDRWLDATAIDYLHPEALDAKLKVFFRNEVVAGLSCIRSLGEDVLAQIEALMLERFRDIALYGRQFERFEKAWGEWLEADAAIDWTEARLQERVEAILAFSSKASKETYSKEALCGCAARILIHYGAQFYNWIDTAIRQGQLFNALEPFEPHQIEPAKLCPELFHSDAGAEARDQIHRLLVDRYQYYGKASYLLRIVVDLLSRLRNIYPVATLHDCSSGGDRNPVRLGKTSLGNLTKAKDYGTKA